MLSGIQVRMARSALGWSVSDLAKQSGVSISTIKRLESDQTSSMRTAVNTAAVRTTLEAAGIEFIGAPGDAPGVRLHAAGQR